MVERAAEDADPWANGARAREPGEHVEVTRSPGGGCRDGAGLSAARQDGRSIWTHSLAICAASGRDDGGEHRERGPAARWGPARFLSAGGGFSAGDSAR